MKRLTWCLVGLALAVVFPLASCTPSPEDQPVYTSYGGSQAPGDYWEYQLDRDAGTFIATNYGTSYGRTTSFSYKGTVEELPSKFLKFAVTETDNANVPVGSISYGIDYPGNCLFVMPNVTGASNYMISMTVLASATYAAGMSFNWVTLPSGTFDIATVSSYGVASIGSVSGTSLELQTAGTKFDGTVGYASMPLYSTQEGFKLFSYGDAQRTNLLSVMSITPSGAFAYDMGAGGGGFGLTAPSAGIDIADALSHAYRGFNTFYGGNMNGVKLTWTAQVAGQPLRLEGGFYTDNDPTKSQGQSGVLSFASAVQTSNGIFRGITDGSGQNYVFVINKVQGKYVMLGFGQTAAPDSKPFTFFVIQSD